MGTHQPTERLVGEARRHLHAVRGSATRAGRVLLEAGSSQAGTPINSANAGTVPRQWPA